MHEIVWKLSVRDDQEITSKKAPRRDSKSKNGKKTYHNMYIENEKEDPLKHPRNKQEKRATQHTTTKQR